MENMPYLFVMEYNGSKDIWQLITNCLGCYDQSALKLVSKFMYSLKHKDTIIIIKNITEKDHIYFDQYDHFNMKIDCSVNHIFSYIKSCITKTDFNFIDDIGIDKSNEEYIKEFIYAIMMKKINISHSVCDIVDGTNHVLFEYNPNSYYYKVRTSKYDFVHDHLYFRIIKKPQ